jgi:glutamate-ammonia-ligase adenylyltransferase
MIVIYDADGIEASDGKRPLASRVYYARLTQAMITAMTAPMAQGRLYEVDMRLRPSGSQGPVATSFASFESYQMGEAWVWEHLALTRADIVAGPQDLARDFEVARGKVLGKSRNRTETLHEVARMRARLAAAKAPDGPWDAKNGPGRLQDIELLAQAGALLKGETAVQIPSGLDAAAQEQIIDAQQAEVLKRAYATCWSLQSATRLLSASVLQSEKLGQAGQSFLTRSLGCDTLQDLEAHLAQTYDSAANIITAAFADDADNAPKETP